MAPKKNGKYKDVALENALKSIRNGQLSANKASQKFGIPRSTLGDKLRGKYRPGKPVGRDPYLTQEEEKSIVK